MADKNFSRMIEILFRAEDFVIVTPPHSERAANVKILWENLSSHGIKNIGVENFVDAVKFLKDTPAEVKIIAVSLYLIGAVRNLV